MVRRCSDKLAKLLMVVFNGVFLYKRSLNQWNKNSPFGCLSILDSHAIMPRDRKRTVDASLTRNETSDNVKPKKASKRSDEPSKEYADFTHWLMKSEGESRVQDGHDFKFSIDDLADCEDQTTHWEGVRNYQARNFMRDFMRVGQKAFFYHSNVKEPGIVGLVEIVKESYPDHTQFEKGNYYFDKNASKDEPRWFMVDVKLVCGIAILVLGFSGIKFNDHLKTVIQNLSGTNIAVIVVGAIIFIISFLGFCGALRESSCLITLFMLCMIVLLIAEIAIACIAFVNRNELQDLVEKGMQKSFKKRHEPLIKDAWDDIEVSFQCCGAISYKQYDNNLPASCCKRKVSICLETDPSFSRKPCIRKVEDFLANQYLGFGVAAIVVAFIEVIGIIFSCCLRSAINERYETV
ncbi:hypothetical protein BIW11_12903 [Tropilaelaps mercedesae]|uniref:Uncharacterized protein n=1 Tax=Tropilaelaps mercedesae TaxID=418985 RepID=A0A1V9X4Y6_9ACAR|nr:hypothetical protein BIW11_12903 [Tropilaelaps mercedesae]